MVAVPICPALSQVKMRTSNSSLQGRVNRSPYVLTYLSQDILAPGSDKIAPELSNSRIQVRGGLHTKTLQNCMAVKSVVAPEQDTSGFCRANTFSFHNTTSVNGVVVTWVWWVRFPHNAQEFCSTLFFSHT